jgi:lysozyme
VEAACDVLPNENQLAAMVCMAWNIGVPRFLKSSVLKAHNRGDFLAASRAFGLWNKAGGVESAGLTRRRAAEAALYLKAPADRVPEPMPQAVQAESSMAKSPIVLGTGATTVVTTLATLSETSAQVKSIRDGLGLGDYAPHVAIGVAVVVGGYVIWQRLKQRAKGWA